jgi:hypothetical protein
LGFCKISPHHSLNQTLKVTPFSPFIHQDLFLLVFFDQFSAHHQTLSHSKVTKGCAYMPKFMHMAENKNHPPCQSLEIFKTQ